MKNYNVTVQVKITKTYLVEANNEDEAAVSACDVFSVLEDSTEENYSQEIMSIEELT